ncbi:ATP-binding protein [Xenophilus arseniciresistens]|uniref:histidine kinase n=1 Tax=Xenophilus arseniciresistens TaxID=1283306 RepID=A0AAE3T1M4_9BURK|nr:ATP-binding protein [Xenophilus arseniciresistens]MDA7418745.1 ATP-binding protein [Xenophilus arseniciresistens]
MSGLHPAGPGSAQASLPAGGAGPAPMPRLPTHAAPAPVPVPAPPTATPPREARARKLLRGSLQRDLRRLGILPCLLLALLLTGWFTHSRLRTLDAVFEAEGLALARQVAALSDLSLYAGDLPALQNLAQAALRTGQATRVEISNSAGIYVSAGPLPGLTQRGFSAPVTLREASQATAFAPPGSAVADLRPIGMVQAFRDTRALSQARTMALLTSAGLALLALVAAWLAVRHLARHVSQPLARLSRTVAELQAGNFEARCELAGDPRSKGPHHELATLAEDVNRLALHLQQHQQISEARVREATAVALMRMTEAEQAALSRARFLAAASHDLRQPLHAMGLFIDGLLADASQAQRPAMQRLQESTAFMSLLLDDLLEISRLDAQVLTPTQSDVRVADLFDALAAQHSAQAVQGRVRLVWQDRGLWVRSDAALLQRVLGNLVSNAIRHVPLDGTVMVVARAREGGVRIEVRDNGVGIAPIHQSRIFEEFYQVSNTERDRRQGFGLGLSICARIAALLGTRIALRSALAHGSTFSIQLARACPVAQTPDDAQAPQAAAPAPASVAGLHCLVVDDDPVILEGTRALLQQWGCSTQMSRSAAEARSQLAAPGARFDAILCDLQLADEAVPDGLHPAQDGLAVLSAAREWQPEALFVVVSGATSAPALQRLRHQGVLLLTKPVAPARLRALLSTQRAPSAPKI